MLGKPEQQRDFFDSYVYERLVPTDHILMQIKREVDFSFVKEEVADLYSPDLGRPSWPAEIVFRMLFLEYYYNLSDVEVAKQTRWNLLFRDFVGLKIDDQVPDDTTLVVFRRRLGDKRFEALFDKVVQQCKQKGLLKQKLKIVDASVIIADVAIPNTVNLLQQGRKVIIRKIKEEAPGEAEKLQAKYVVEKKHFRKPTVEELSEEISLSQQFLEEVKSRYGEEVDEYLGYFQKIVKGEQEEKIVSFHDLDARHGKKSKNKPFVGYKAHIAEDESEIVTSVDLLRGNQNEGSELNCLLEKEDAKEIKSEAVTGDGIYDTAENRETLKEKGLAAYIPSRMKKRRADKFVYDLKKEEVKCQVKKVSLGKIRQEQGYLYYFSVKDCQGCPAKDSCLKEGEMRARVFISDDYIQKMDEDEEEKRKALIKRKMVERKFGEAKKWHRLGRARYRGYWRVKIQVLMVFLVMNIKRMVRLLLERRLKMPSLVGNC